MKYQALTVMEASQQSSLIDNAIFQFKFSLMHLSHLLSKQ